MKTPKIIKSEKGAAAVEFAIVLPLLVLFFCGMIEFGLLFYNKQVITNASREGARAAITKTLDGTSLKTDDKAQVNQIIDDYCENNLINLGGSNDLNVDEIAISSVDLQKDITVTVPYVYNFLFTGILGFGNITLTGETVMRME